MRRSNPYAVASKMRAGTSSCRDSSSTTNNTQPEVALAQRYPVRLQPNWPDLLREHVIDEIIFAADSRLAELEEACCAMKMA